MVTRRTASDAIFLDLYHGAGRAAVVEFFLASAVARRLGLRSSSTIGDGGWATSSTHLNVFDHPVSREEWARRSRPSDAAVVVVRDPRSIVADDAAELRALWPQLERREATLAAMARLKDQERMLRSWAGRTVSSTELVLTYEDLAARPLRVLSEFADFVDVPGAAATRPTLFGDTVPVTPCVPPAPHDWHPAFDNVTAPMFETMFPGLVADLGYDDADWADHFFFDVAVVTFAADAEATAPKLTPVEVATPPRPSTSLFDRRPA